MPMLKGTEGDRIVRGWRGVLLFEGELVGQANEKIRNLARDMAVKLVNEHQYLHALVDAKLELDNVDGNIMITYWMLVQPFSEPMNFDESCHWGDEFLGRLEYDLKAYVSRQLPVLVKKLSE